LDNLAGSDNLTAPTATQTVKLANVNGVEEYSVDITGTGTSSVLTVDQNGNPVTAPTKSTINWGDLTDTAVTNEVDAIATALNLTAPTATTSVVVTATNGTTSSYTITLTGATGGGHTHGVTVTLDTAGNPIGDITLPFSVMLPAVQDGLNAAAPQGATALSATSTQPVVVTTVDGVTLYSTTFITTGTRTTVTVNNQGVLTSLPSSTTTEFQNLLPAVQDELQSLAADNGYTGTIAGTQSVKEYIEEGGTTVFAVTLPVSKTSSHSGKTYTIQITVASDENGNPTVPPTNTGGGHGGGGGAGCDGGGGFGGFGGALSLVGDILSGVFRM
jgi:hypothetical protein